MARSMALLAALLSVSACTTMQYTPNTVQPITGGVQVLYEYPQDGRYKSLGTIEVYHYQPGLSAPTVSDALPKLKAKAATVGGNALIVRSHQVGQFDRSISITGEVLFVDPVSK